MPKLPRGMFRRGESFYVRERRGGKDRWISLGNDYPEAVRELRNFRRRGEPVAGARATVAQVAEKWLATRITTGRNERGQRLARTRVEKYLVPYVGHMLVSKVTATDLREYRLWLDRQCRTVTTVHHVLGDARSLFLWCEDSGLVEKSPVPRRLLPRLQERPPDRLTDEEIEQVLAIPEPWAFVIRLGLGTGLRWGELTRAQARDLQDGMLVVHQTKSGKVRRVPVPPELHRELRGRVGRLVPFAERSPGSFANAVRRHSGVPRFHVHQLRHTFACGWLQRGEPRGVATNPRACVGADDAALRAPDGRHGETGGLPDRRFVIVTGKNGSRNGSRLEVFHSGRGSSDALSSPLTSAYL